MTITFLSKGFVDKISNISRPKNITAASHLWAYKKHMNIKVPGRGAARNFGPHDKKMKLAPHTAAVTIS